MTTVCSSDDPVFDATTSGGSISWTYSGASAGFADNTAEDATLNDVTGNGTATITVTSANCGNASATHDITVTPTVDIDDSGIPDVSTDDQGTEIVSVNVYNVTSTTSYAFNFASATGTQPSVTGFNTASNSFTIGGNSVTWTLTVTQIGVSLEGFPTAKAELTLADGTADNFSSGNNVTFTATGPCLSDMTTFSYTALPVEFTYFKANIVGNTTQLEWETASELNNEAFYVERSVDGVNFIEIAAIQGAGTSVEPIQYGHIDNAPVKGTNYYRLRQVDFDGTMEYSEVAEVYYEGSTFVVSVNPTAATNEVQIVLGETFDQDLTVNVFDALGRNVMNTSINAGNNVLPIDVSNFSTGQYFIKLSNKSTSITKTFFRM